MKNTTKTIEAVFSVFLVAALFIGAASASEYREVGKNGVAFVYEKITISGATNPLVLYDDQQTNVVNSISLSTDASGNKYYNLLADVVGGKYGRYFYDGAAKTNYVDIWYPELVVKAELAAASAGDSIIGKTVTKSTNVKFIIQAPKVGSASPATTTAPTALAGISQLSSNMNSLNTYNTTYYGLDYTTAVIGPANVNQT